jgi:hypothetical protein
MTTEIPQWAAEAWAKVRIDQGRHDYLERLYVLDGRDSPLHPMHSLYTGLYTDHIAKMENEG